MNATIAKRFTFDAAHWLPHVPRDHKCRRTHGHTYEVEIILHGPVGDNGFVADYDVIRLAWEPIFELIDHHTLNEIPGLENPTTENLIRWIFGRIALDKRPEIATLKTTLSKIRVYESSTTWCEVTAKEWAYDRDR